MNIQSPSELERKRSTRVQAPPGASVTGTVSTDDEAEENNVVDDPEAGCSTSMSREQDLLPTGREYSSDEQDSLEEVALDADVDLPSDEDDNADDVDVLDDVASQENSHMPIANEQVVANKYKAGDTVLVKFVVPIRKKSTIVYYAGKIMSVISDNPRVFKINYLRAVWTDKEATHSHWVKKPVNPDQQDTKESDIVFAMKLVEGRKDKNVFLKISQTLRFVRNRQ